jgi:hypothetical protein
MVVGAVAWGRVGVPDVFVGGVSGFGMGMTAGVPGSAGTFEPNGLGAVDCEGRLATGVDIGVWAGAVVAAAVDAAGTGLLPGSAGTFWPNGCGAVSIDDLIIS